MAEAKTEIDAAAVSRIEVIACYVCNKSRFIRVGLFLRSL